jgi:hypothetical protein
MNRTPQYDINVAQEILNRLMIAYTQMGSGLTTVKVTIDNVDVEYRNLNDIQRAMNFWETRVATLSKRRNRAIGFNLGGFRP